MVRDRLRIAMLFDWFFYYTASIANALAEYADVLVVTRDRGDEMGRPGADAVDAKREGLDSRIGLEIVGGRQSDPRSRRRARRAAERVKEFSADVVHEQEHYDWRLRTVARSAGLPRVLTIHDVVMHERAEDRHNVVHRDVALSLRKESAALIVHGQQQASLAARQPWYQGAPIFVVPLGLVGRPARPQPLPDRPTALFFGRIEYYKGLDVLVAAMKRLPRTLDLRVIVAGRGSEVERCRALAAGDDRFDWRIGFVEDADLPALFAESSFVVLPYRDASQSAVIPLAFANRRVAVATDAGSLAEVIDDGKTGAVVPAQDPAALADAMARLAADADTLARMSDAAYATVVSGPLSAEAIADKHLEVYRHVLERPR